MSLGDELKYEVRDIFRKTWATRDGIVVPDTENLQMGNDAVKLDAVVLYADLADSTTLVDNYEAEFAAEVYKTYLHCTAKIIRDEGGEITAYDGDRIMAIYLGDYKRSSAARTALKINYAVKEIINPALAQQYPNKSYRVKQVVGVDASDLLVARTGIRGANDLVWVGRAANYAAKMSAFNEDGYCSFITDRIFDKMTNEIKADSNGRSIWEKRAWSSQNLTVYRSRWQWPL